MTQPMTLALANGTRIAEYRIERLLGEGGFGLTYLALDENLHKQVAIKEYLPVDFAMRGANAQVIPRTEASQNDFAWGLEAFINEARTLAKFHNPYIVQVFRYFEANGTAYIVMEFVEGRTLRETVNELGQLQEAEIMAILLPVLDGLMDVHEAGILHRDIKPENILIRDNGKPVLIDFGAARQALGGKSRSITTIITPGYVPIEQYSTKGNVGPWSDIYSLAAVAYFCLTQKRPEDASDRVVQDDLVPARDAANGMASNAFLEAIDQGLAVSPQDRPQTLELWVKALRGETQAQPDSGSLSAVQDSAPTKVVPPLPQEPATAPREPGPRPSTAVERSSNRRGLVILLGLLLIALGVLMAQRVLIHTDTPDVVAAEPEPGGSDAVDAEAETDGNSDPVPTEPATEAHTETEPDVAHEEPAIEEPAPVASFHLTITTEPEQAHITLLGDPRRYSDGMELETGSWRFRISLAGFRTVEITVESSGDDVVRHISLEHQVTAEEQALFDRAKSSRSVEDLQAYLDSYPLGSYNERIRGWLETAREQEQQASEDQAGERRKQTLRAWRACEEIPWKASTLNGRAVFDIPEAASGNFRMRIGRFAVQPNQITAIGSSSPLRELCSSQNCYAVTGSFGLSSYTITQGGQESRGEACFFYPDERSHAYRIEF